MRFLGQADLEAPQGSVSAAAFRSSSETPSRAVFAAWDGSTLSSVFGKTLLNALLIKGDVCAFIQEAGLFNDVWAYCGTRTKNLGETGHTSLD